ncbi:MAG TPA: integrase core domain-containing protein [Pirellulales bacterium]|nr:integrase core domain-containing protein [Pirellulales bacterium]
MQNIYRSLLLLLAGATQKELARHVRYLKAENEVLRGKLPKRVPLTHQERNRLVRFGSKLGQALDSLVSIVHPGTLRRWIREDRKGKRKTPAPRGRRRTAEQIRRLILKLAKENSWGYTRILGELKKLGVRAVSRNTVKNILKANGLEPGPQRGPGTWDEFLKIHAATLWQCDFFSKRVLTPKGFRELFVVVFLHVGTRRAFLTPATEHPNEAWVIQQAQAFVRHARAKKLGAEIIMHDRDTKFTASFDAALRQEGLDPRPLAYRAPNTAAYVERFVQSIKQECLDHFMVLGQRHMDHLCKEFVEHYHAERPHQGLDNEPLKPSGKKRKRQIDLIPISDVACRKRLGGLLKHYYRKAA